MHISRNCFWLHWITSLSFRTTIRPGKTSFKLAGGLLLSSVSLYSAFFTGGTGFITSFMGSLALAVATLGAPANNNHTGSRVIICSLLCKTFHCGPHWFKQTLIYTNFIIHALIRHLNMDHNEWLMVWTNFNLYYMKLLVYSFHDLLFIVLKLFLDILNF